MTLAEAARLATNLASDPASHLFAAAWGWDHPLSREALILSDLYDLTALVGHVRHPKPYPRPMPKAGRQAELDDAADLPHDQLKVLPGYSGGRTSDEVKALLRPQ